MLNLHGQLPRGRVTHHHPRAGAPLVGVQHLGQRKLQIRRRGHPHHLGRASQRGHGPQRGALQRATSTKRNHHGRMVAQRPVTRRALAALSPPVLGVNLVVSGLYRSGPTAFDVRQHRHDVTLT
jgi:hypothetical protein